VTVRPPYALHTFIVNLGPPSASLVSYFLLLDRQARPVPVCAASRLRISWQLPLWERQRRAKCQNRRSCSLHFYCVCVFIYYWSTYYKAVRVEGGGNNGGHVLRETTSRSLCGLVYPSRTSERGERDIEHVKGGGGEEGERERERAKEVRLHYSLGYSG
jgi:hypothetical protein